ncbi:hypothetical protein JXM67_15060 [candidate division WOR-3 bacterium]|nr:hypothetical protein [candidate division WOR-3 bacterium]
MRKILVLAVAVLLAALPVTLGAADRCVVLELFCRTACTYCPGAAIGVDQTAADHQDDILVVEYHVADPFQNVESLTRAVFYLGDTITIPCAIFDGVMKYIGPGAASNYESAFQTRKEKPAPLEILMDKTEDAYLKGGTLTATITNTSEEDITGIVQFTVTESNIPYSWVHSKYWVHFVCRDMLEDAEGALITIAAGADTTISREYVIDPSWPYHTDDIENLEYGCFIQDTAVYTGRLKEIYQGAVIPLVNPLSVQEVTRTPDLEIVTPVGSVITLRFCDLNECVNVDIFDASGRKVDELSIAGGTVSWGEGFDPGIYFFKMKSSAAPSRKVVLVK